MDEIKELENRTVQQLKKQMDDPQKRGICADDDDVSSQRRPKHRSLSSSATWCKFLSCFVSNEQNKQR